jgi:hypothetical protein
MRAIDARSIDRLRTEHCRTLLLHFRDPVKEAKVRIFFLNFLRFLRRLFAVRFGKGQNAHALLLLLDLLFHCDFFSAGRRNERVSGLKLGKGKQN